MSYTKGPWRARTKEMKHHIRTDVQAKLANRWKTIFRGNYYCNEKDNANLIAAAPELVEALEQVRGVIEEHCDHANISIIGARDLINYVLTKAKGGQL